MSPEGHYGAHSVLCENGQRLRWLGHGEDARKEDGTSFYAEPEPATCLGCQLPENHCCCGTL